MAKVTLIFESDSLLPDGPETISYTVDESAAPYFAGTIANHPIHGFVVEEIEVTETDDDGNTITNTATTRNPGTFRTGVNSWAELNVHEPIIGAVNAFAKASAEAEALAAISVPTVEATKGKK